MKSITEGFLGAKKMATFIKDKGHNINLGGLGQLMNYYTVWHWFQGFLGPSDAKVVYGIPVGEELPLTLYMQTDGIEAGNPSSKAPCMCRDG